VTAVIGKSDSYAEIPWIAFALGVVAAGFAVVAADAARPQWTTAHTAILQTTIILGAGAACALLAIFSTPVAQLFLRASRRDVEVRQYAESLFLTRELFRTRDRLGLLILVSLFERRVDILPDTGFRGRVSDADWAAVVTPITTTLRSAGPGAALQEGLKALDALLARTGVLSGGAPDELPNRPIEERGV